MASPIADKLDIQEEIKVNEQKITSAGKTKWGSRSWLKLFVWFCAASFVAVILIIWISDARTRAVAKPYLFTDPQQISQSDVDRVAVVLGCSPTIAGRVNLFYQYRIDAAVELWFSGKVRGFIVSGDNRTKHYSEPDAMKASLIKAGVPEDKIICDYAGLCTLDSIVRADRNFGKNRLIIVSQEFHNERAICIAKHHQIDAVGYKARDVTGAGGARTHMREKLARVKMWLDLKILKTKPKHHEEKHVILGF